VIRLLIFEDRHWARLGPLTDLLPVPALGFGASDLAGRWRCAVEVRLPGTALLGFAARPRALAVWHDQPPPEGSRPQGGDEVLAVNAAALPGPWLDHALGAAGPARWRAGDRIAGARLAYQGLAPALAAGADFEARLAALPATDVEVRAEFLDWPWDLVRRNGAALAEDLATLRPGVHGMLDPRAAVYSLGRVAIGEGTRVDAFAVLDARGGPIRIGNEVLVAAHTVITGPCAIGSGTQLLGGSIAASTIGPQCRIAGEVDACIWQGWANKRHHGFVGHSAIGEWVNLGALTTTSDLKNNYGEVRVRVAGRELSTGTNKLGAFIGAHVKTGIGTLLPTGAMVGTGSNLFGGGRFAPKEAPPFAWWDGERVSEHRLERMLETARAALARRDRSLGPDDEAALRSVFEASREARRAAVVAPSA
jgi:UDP-N-acetylglucosamine diphosphorylase/glucosamine-1-phosphate N-acetyltransferase